MAHATQAPDAILCAAAAELLTTTSAGEVLEAAARHARNLLTTDIAFVMLVDPATNMLKLRSSVGHRAAAFIEMVRPVRALTAVGSGKPVQSEDFLNDPRFDHDPPTDDIARKEGMRSVMAVPLPAPGRMLGALYVGHRSARRFGADEIEALQQLAVHVTAALLHAETRADLEQKTAEALRRAEEAEQARALLAHAENVRNAVSAELQERAGLTALAVALSDCIDCPVIVTDWKLAVLAQARKSPAALLERPESREAAAACTQTHRPARAGKDWSVAPIEAGRDLRGYLWIGHSPDPKETDAIEHVLQRIAPLAAVEMLSEGDTERRVQGDFIYELLSERQPDFSVLEARAAQVRISSASPHRPVIVNVSAGDDQWSTRLEAARRLASAVRPHDFAAVYGRHLVLLITPADRPHVEQALAHVTQLLERNNLTATVAAGAPCRDLRESRDSIRATIRLQDLVGHKNETVLWTEGLEALTQLFDPSQKDRLEGMCRSALAPLQNRTGLMDALHAYYGAGGNKANAARRLGIHVNTLRQRLERATELLGGSVDDSVRAVPLRLALLVREVAM